MTEDDKLSFFDRMGYADAAAAYPLPKKFLSRIAAKCAAAYRQGYNRWHKEQTK